MPTIMVSVSRIQTITNRWSPRLSDGLPVSLGLYLAWPEHLEPGDPSAVFWMDYPGLVFSSTSDTGLGNNRTVSSPKRYIPLVSLSNLKPIMPIFAQDELYQARVKKMCRLQREIAVMADLG
jgi:hypothetical protein